jgi:hypothetical protein
MTKLVSPYTIKKEYEHYEAIWIKFQIRNIIYMFNFSSSEIQNSHIISLYSKFIHI